MQEDKKERIPSIIGKIEAVQQENSKCENLILKGQNKSVCQRLQQIIKRKIYYPLSEFKAYGNAQSWKQEFLIGPFEWFEMQKKISKSEWNIFDLFNICCMVQLHQSQINKKNALNLYQDLMKTVGQREELQMGIGNIYYYQEQYFQAEKHYKRALMKIPQCQNVLESIAWTCHCLEKREETLQWAKKCLKMNSQNQRANYLSINSSEDSEVTMISKLNKLAQIYPTYLSLYIRLGQLSKDIESAVKYFNKVLECSPKSDRVIAKIGQTYLKMENNVQQAEKFASHAIQVQSQSIHGIKLLGLIELKKARYDEAIQHFNNGSKLAPHNIGLYYQLGDIYYYYKKDINQAIKYFTICLKLNPESTKFHKKLGRCYFALKMYSEARNSQKNAFEINPTDSQNLGYLAELEEQANRLVLAIEFYGRAHQLKPERSTYVVGLLNCYLKLNLKQEFQDQANYFIAKGSDNVKKQASKMLGNEIYTTRNYAKALNCLLQFQRFNKNLKSESIWSKFSQPRDRSNIIQDINQKKQIIKQEVDRMIKEQDNFYTVFHLMNVCCMMQMLSEKKMLEGLAYQIHKAQFVSEEAEKQLLKLDPLLKAEK